MKKTKEDRKKLDIFEKELLELLQKYHAQMTFSEIIIDGNSYEFTN